MKKRYRPISILVLFTFILMSAVVPLDTAKANDIPAKNDPWKQKSILHYLLFTRDAGIEQDVMQMRKDLSLNADKLTQLKAIAEQEFIALRNLKKESDEFILNRKLTMDEKRKKVKEMRYNEHHDQILQQSDKKVRQVLKDQYPKFRQFIKNWWAGESVKRITELRTQAAVNNIRVYATQYNPNTPGAVEVALPDKYLKFANLGWDYTYPNPPYTVNIQRESTGQWIYDIRVDEVGPWNTDDNYWDDNTKRRIYSKLCCTTQQLDPGIPESYAAYYEGYNNGKDQFGRNVANPAGIDLTPETAKKLGLAYLQNAWVIFTTDDFGGSNPEKLYKVIAGSFSDKQNALDREAYLESKGIECIIMQVTVSGKTYYRVQAGAYRERANAEARLQEVKDAGVTDAFIVYE